MQDSEESTQRRVLRGRGKALHRSGFAGIQSARVCSEGSEVLTLGVVLGNPSIQILVY